MEDYNVIWQRIGAFLGPIILATYYGFPQGFDFKNLDTLGLRLVKNLSNQIDGQINLDGDNGVNFILQFEELKYKKTY